MELKANECRYGNFIIGTYESEDDNLVHETICEFKFYDCYNNYYNVESKERIEEFTGFKPIPLTEEWLLKFGFEKIGRNFTTKDNFVIWLSLSSETYQFRLHGYGKDIEIKFVHQLQNLYYALTNEELKLK